MEVSKSLKARIRRILIISATTTLLASWFLIGMYLGRLTVPKATPQPMANWYLWDKETKDWLPLLIERDGTKLFCFMAGFTVPCQAFDDPYTPNAIVMVPLGVDPNPQPAENPIIQYQVGLRLSPFDFDTSPRTQHTAHLSSQISSAQSALLLH